MGTCNYAFMCWFSDKEFSVMRQILLQMSVQEQLPFNLGKDNATSYRIYLRSSELWMRNVWIEHLFSRTKPSFYFLLDAPGAVQLLLLFACKEALHQHTLNTSLSFTFRNALLDKSQPLRKIIFATKFS